MTRNVTQPEASGQCSITEAHIPAGIAIYDPIGRNLPPSPPVPSLGDTIRLEGPDKTLNLIGNPRHRDLLNYHLTGPTASTAHYLDELPAPFFTPGKWTFSTPGVPGLEPFRVDAEIPGPIRFRNPKSLRSIERTRDFSPQWDTLGMLPTDTLTIDLGTIRCTVRAQAGEVRIPSTLLGQQRPAAYFFVNYNRPDTVLHLRRSGADPIPAILRWSSYLSIPVDIR